MKGIFGKMSGVFGNKDKSTDLKEIGGGDELE
jgi:hypothetical protein